MGVRLGEYHSVNDTDCVWEHGIQECSDPVMDYTVNKTIIHPNYYKTARLNDITLLRLNGEIEGYSDYIRPICLPFSGTKFANIGDTVTISGWAELISTENCGKSYKTFNITENHLCTMTLNNSTDQSCKGDAGGPVMLSHRLQWHQEGIVSFGYGCGPEFPNGHTRVQKYLEWIEENIHP
ncbi:hypothetical protein ILUMI_02953 [Ignelater luminosus]|uniref:Peptidase S1 domain-containing protein n=1 Tax=Ignelater luminosus TaxID=2038154 RepID=A0A8K0GKE2_IGNLU|nr:hypothetical protein ILUMI_02953 [Ignelater luminosus]